MLGPTGVGRLRRTLNGQARRQMVGDLIDLHSGVLDVDRNSALVLSNEWMLAARLKEKPGQKVTFTCGGSEIAFHLDDANEVGGGVIEAYEVIEIGLQPIGNVVPYGFLELLLDLFFIVPKGKLAP